MCLFLRARVRIHYTDDMRYEMTVEILYEMRPESGWEIAVSELIPVAARLLSMQRDV